MMLSHSLTNLLAEARVDTLHQAGRNDRHSRRFSGTARHDDHSPSGTVASHVARLIARAFDDGRAARDDAAAVGAVVGHH